MDEARKQFIQGRPPGDNPLLSLSSLLGAQGVRPFVRINGLDVEASRKSFLHLSLSQEEQRITGRNYEARRD